MTFVLIVTLLQKVVSQAEMLWERMKDVNDKEFPITHDGKLMDMLIDIQ